MVISDKRTSLNNLQPENRIQVFPIPSNGKVNIKLQKSITSEFKIEVFNIQGILIFPKRIIMTSEHSFEIELPEGIYFVKIHDKEKIYNFKLIITSFKK